MNIIDQYCNQYTVNIKEKKKEKEQDLFQMWLIFLYKKSFNILIRYKEKCVSIIFFSSESIKCSHSWNHSTRKFKEDFLTIRGFSLVNIIDCQRRRRRTRKGSKCLNKWANWYGSKNNYRRWLSRVLVTVFKIVISQNFSTDNSTSNRNKK